MGKKSVAMILSVFIIILAITPLAVSAENNSVYYGDANQDGIINIIDLIALKKAIIEDTVYAAATDRLDCNHDWIIGAEDLAVLKKELLDIESITQGLVAGENTTSGFSKPY